MSAECLREAIGETPRYGAGFLYRPGERSPDWVRVKRPCALPPERFRH